MVVQTFRKDAFCAARRCWTAATDLHHNSETRHALEGAASRYMARAWGVDARDHGNFTTTAAMSRNTPINIISRPVI